VRCDFINHVVLSVNTSTLVVATGQKWSLWSTHFK
jgi:hypothetical protein